MLTRETRRAVRRDPLFFLTPIISLVVYSALLGANLAPRTVVAITSLFNVSWAIFIWRIVKRAEGGPAPWVWLGLGGAILAALGLVAFGVLSVTQSQALPDRDRIVDSLAVLGGVLGIPLGSCFWLAKQKQYRRTHAASPRAG
jgi:FtsH-binding integral membrane protein